MTLDKLESPFRESLWSDGVTDLPDRLVPLRRHRGQIQTGGPDGPQMEPICRLAPPGCRAAHVVLRRCG